MDTSNLDEYIFKSFYRNKGMKINFIDFTISSRNKLDVDFIISLFSNLDISMKEMIIKNLLRKKTYKYYFKLNISDEINEQEYALFIGKIFILCGKLYARIQSIGINA